MSTNDIIIPTTCANCSKGEEDSAALKNCVACKMVKYCSRDCQKAHRSQHKKECRKRAAELHDEKLFKQPPAEDCPICFLRVPALYTGHRYQTCCGKTICSGCIYAGSKMDGNSDQLCPFCRFPAPKTDEEIINMLEKRVEMGDPGALCSLGNHYDEGWNGIAQNHDRALEHWHRSGELGHAGSYHNVGNAYFNGEGVERDEKKATHYYELAAMWGDAASRHNLGNAEIRAGNIERALKHYMIAAGGGNNDSLNMIQHMYTNGHATRDDSAKALKAYQAYLSEIKSDDRDKAAAFQDELRSY